MADRVLDVLPGEGGDEERRGDLEDRPWQVHPLRARGGREDDDREVPEVDAVRALADPAHRPTADDRPEPRRRVRHRGHRDRGGEREDQEAAPVEERRELVRAPEHQRDHAEADRAGDVDRAPGARRDPPAEVPARPDRRQRGTDHQLECTGVGPVVDAGRIDARLVEDEHQDRRREGEAEDRQAEPGTQAPREPRLGDELDPEDHQERPDDVELLLDRQRPEMVERAGRLEGREVRDVVEDQPPVVDVCRGGRRRPPEVGRLVRPEDRRPGDDDDQHQKQRRQQAPRPRQPERLQPDAAALDLAEQDVGDQVAAEREEDADAEQAAGSPPEAEVVGDDAENRNRPQPVEAGHVALVWLDGFRHR